VGVRSPRKTLDRQFGAFLKKERAARTFAEFSRIVGLPPSTLYRLERGEQSITLGKLQMVLSRLRCKTRDIFTD
jgi:transcriptional regulator with XRE-family HTH domain